MGETKNTAHFTLREREAEQMQGLKANRNTSICGFRDEGAESRADFPKGAISLPPMGWGWNRTKGDMPGFTWVEP